MNCPQCGTALKKQTKKVRAKGGSSCVFELIGLLILITTFWTIIGAIVGILFIYLGHRAAYAQQTTLLCPACNAKYPAGIEAS